MKRKKQTKEILKPDFREKFTEYLNKCGELLDEYNVPQELIDKLAALDTDIEADIDEYTMNDETIREFIKDDSELKSDLLYDIEDWAGKDEWEMLADRLDTYSNYRTIQLESLPEQMAFDEFRERLSENPYQLKIA